jgi:hypothetical protein
MQSAKNLGDVVENGTLRHFRVSSLRLIAKKACRKLSFRNKLESASPKNPIGFNKTLYLFSDSSEIIGRPDSRANTVAVERSTPPASNLESLIGRQIMSLASKSDAIHVSIDHSEAELPMVSVTLLGGATQKHATRSTLDRALAALLDEEEVRRCSKCTRIKPIEAFAKSTSFCRICEVDRVRQYRRMKRSARESAEAARTESADANRRGIGDDDGREPDADQE